MSAKAPSLAELQDGLRRALTEPRGVDAAMRVPRARRAGLWVAETPALGRRLRLAVYADAYFARLLDSLEGDFPRLRKALGAAAFRRLAAEYIERHPSDSPNLADLGAKLPDFVRSRKAAHWAELAALDAAVHRVLYADRGSRLDAARLQAVPGEAWPGLRFDFSPAVVLLRLHYRSDSRPRRAPRHVVVWRDQSWARVADVGRAEWEALDAMRRGLSLGEVCGNVSPPLDRWFQNGWLTGVRLPA